MLSDIEKQKIITFNEDKVLVSAVRKIMLASIYENGTLRKDVEPEPLKNGALGLVFATLQGRVTISNEQLGEDLRAYAQGVNLLEGGFNELQKIKKEEKVGEEDNEAI